LTVDEIALLVVERLTVVEVDRARSGRSSEIDSGDESDRVAPSEGRSTTDEVATREDVTTALEDGNGLERCGNLDGSTTVRGAKVDVVVEVVVVRL
jgi:hypothetical protein